MPAPAFDDDQRFTKRAEYCPVQQFVAQPGIEALDVTILPWAPRRDVGRLRANHINPFLHGFSDELGPIVRTNVSRHATKQEQIRQNIYDVRAVELARNTDRQTFARELIDNVEHAISAPVVCAVMHEVIRPDVVRPLGPQPKTRAVVQP